MASLLSVTFEGILTVTDAVRFGNTLVEGIGRGKAFGLGLLTIIRLRGSDHGNLPGMERLALQALPQIGDRLTFLYLEHCQINREGSAILIRDDRGTTRIPAAGPLRCCWALVRRLPTERWNCLETPVWE